LLDGEGLDKQTAWLRPPRGAGGRCEQRGQL